MTSNSISKQLLFLVLLILVLLPYIYISLFTNPVADDFMYAHKAKAQDLFPALLEEYLTWNGRYISNIFVLKNPIVYGSFTGYKIVPVLIIIATIGSVSFFIKVITQNYFNKIQRYTGALFFTVLFLSQMPKISEGIYWYTGSVTYQLGHISLLCFIALLGAFYRKSQSVSSKWILFSSLILLAFITIGFNETIMIATLCFIFSLYLVFKLSHLKNSRYLIILAISIIIFCGFMIFSPGNAIRESHFIDNHKLFSSLYLSTGQTIRYFLKWSFSIPLLLISIYYYLINKQLSKNIPLFRASFYLTPILSSALLLTVIFIGFFPSYWATGDLGQLRSVNTSYFLFLIMWFVNLTVIYNRFKLPFASISNKISLIVSGLSIIFLVFTKNGFNLLSDLKNQSHRAYNTEMTQRYSKILNNNESVCLEFLKNKPEALFVSDITEETNSWQNDAYLLFFEKTNLKLVAASKCED